MGSKGAVLYEVVRRWVEDTHQEIFDGPHGVFNIIAVHYQRNMNTPMETIYSLPLIINQAMGAR